MAGLVLGVESVPDGLAAGLLAGVGAPRLGQQACGAAHVGRHHLDPVGGIAQLHRDQLADQPVQVAPHHQHVEPFRREPSRRKWQRHLHDGLW